MSSDLQGNALQPLLVLMKAETVSEDVTWTRHRRPCRDSLQPSQSTPTLPVLLAMLYTSAAFAMVLTMTYGACIQ